MPKIKKIGVLTGGGDAPGLNAVIRAVVKAAYNAGVEVVGLEDSFDGLVYPTKSRVLGPRDVTGILRLGGTILGTVNRGNPFVEPVVTPEGTFNYGDRVGGFGFGFRSEAAVAFGRGGGVRHPQRCVGKGDSPAEGLHLRLLDQARNLAG